MAEKSPDPGGKVGSKSIGRERNAAARAYIQTIVDEECDGNKTIAAGRFGITQSYLYEFLGGQRGAGMKLLNGVARYKGVSIDRIIGNVPWSSAPTANNLEIAIAYLGEKLSPEAVKTARDRFAGEEATRAPFAWGSELARINAELIGAANMVTRADARALPKRRKKSKPPASSRSPSRKVGT